MKKNKKLTQKETIELHSKQIEKITECISSINLILQLMNAKQQLPNGILGRIKNIIKNS